MTKENLNLTEGVPVNRVAESGIVTIDLEQFYPSQQKASFDLKEHLFMNLILKEKDFREKLKNMDWEPFRNKLVAVFCSTDAIIPVWAYMLVSIYLQPVAEGFYFCEESELDQFIFHDLIANMDVASYKDQRVIIKGCSDKPVPESAYLAITQKLRPVVKSLMYGEACSNVPLYKKPKQ